MPDEQVPILNDHDDEDGEEWYRREFSRWFRFRQALLLQMPTWVLRLMARGGGSTGGMGSGPSADG